MFYHRARFLRASATSKETAVFQVLTLKLTGVLEDLRPLSGAAWYDPDPARYGPAQGLGAQVRDCDGDGIVYASVRRPGWECVPGFRPDRFSECRHARLVQCYWDGAQIMGF